MKLLLLGATVLVGRTVLKQALSKDAISEVVAPTRRPLAPQNKLVNPVNAALDELTPRVKSWNIDAVVSQACPTRGTGRPRVELSAPVKNGAIVAGSSRSQWSTRESPRSTETQ
jgi:hypothetical protein